MNGVVLYSGRWRPSIATMVHNHRTFVVDPYHLDVVVVGVQSQICNMHHFVSDVKKTWNLPKNRLIVSNYNYIEPHSKIDSNLSAWKREQLRNWEVQFSHVRIAFSQALKWKHHDVFIRARIDRLFTSTLVIPFVRNHVFGIISNYGWSADRNISILNDWFYVTDVHGMSVITNTSFTIIDKSIRCFAACPEEQIMLHIRLSHIPIVSLNTKLEVESKNNWCKKK